MKQPVIVLGSGGHARVLISMLRRLEVEIIGIADPSRPAGHEVFGVEVLGDDGAVLNYSPERVVLVNGIGSLPGDNGIRARLYRQFCEYGYQFKTVVDPRAFVADDAELAQGVQVMVGAIIQTGAQIAENCIVNSGAIVEHDCRLGRHSHIAPGAVLSGGVVVGDHVHIGTNATVIQGIHIAPDSVIGAGSVVTRDVAYRQIVYPARPHIRDL